MSGFFVRILNMSISAGWLVLAVIALRMILKNAPKYIRCVLWALVGVRLLCPVSLQSALSLVPDSGAFSQKLLGTSAAQGASQEAAQNVFYGAQTVGTAPAAQTMQSAAGTSFADVAAWVWLAGAAAMLVWAVVSELRLRRRVAASIELERGVRICDDIDTPFILGIVRPRIYLPSSLCEAQRGSVTAHERAHLARLDHLWKPLGYALLAVYWFHPLIWVAYILLCRDIELACDERVIRDMDTAEKQRYSTALLECSMPRRMVAACPLAFGEVGVKERIRSVFSYRKPALWVTIAALAVCAVLCVCFLTDRPTSLDSEEERILHEEIMWQGVRDYQFEDDEYPCEAHKILGVSRKGDRTTVWLVADFGVYVLDSNGDLEERSGWIVPAVAKLDLTEGTCEYAEPRDGTYYAKDIRKMFPLRLQSRGIDCTRYSEMLGQQCSAEAKEYFMNRNTVTSGSDTPEILSGNPSGAPDWGISFSIKNLTPVSATLVFSQEGGAPTGELFTGSPYRIDRYTDGEWAEAEKMTFEHELVWTSEAWGIVPDFSSEYDCDWSFLYGELPDGYYRICKSIMDLREPGDFDEAEFAACFAIGSPDGVPPLELAAFAEEPIELLRGCTLEELNSTWGAAQGGYDHILSGFWDCSGRRLMVCFDDNGLPTEATGEVIEDGNE